MELVRDDHQPVSSLESESDLQLRKFTNTKNSNVQVEFRLCKHSTKAMNPAQLHQGRREVEESRNRHINSVTSFCLKHTFTHF